MNGRRPVIEAAQRALGAAGRTLLGVSDMVASEADAALRWSSVVSLSARRRTQGGVRCTARHGNHGTATGQSQRSHGALPVSGTL